ncbi:MAG TPA: ATP-binding protein [Oligoflexus sp.]|uniref:ATP-binding protein n=1 Tax=Oligoflexus sp. TaxID=1971216 RepID=UPI002D809EB2|nr:ATP-binding protein [Oligoflexus sp.]HET9238519.1 ATP-binding protein [Oligoflexus sp.]
MTRQSSSTPIDLNAILAGGGKMGVLIRSFDWSTTPLGPIESWPQSLLTSVSIILNSQHPMWIGWGPVNTFLYNDPYIDVLSLAKHPWALGRPAAEVWAEIWDICGPLADKVFQRGEPSFVSDVQLFMSRGDCLEETYYSFSYSPIRDETGSVGGLFCPSAETTAKILSERRLATLSELSGRALSEKSSDAVWKAAAEALSKNPADIPFALLYRLSSDRNQSHLMEHFGLDSATGLLYEDLDVHGKAEGQLWPLQSVVDSLHPQVCDLSGIPHRPTGLAQQTVHEALVLPIVSPGQDQASGILIAGINPCRKLDTEYETFLKLAANQMAAALQSAEAYESEKSRAEKLAELDQAKTRFFSNISHEFRTPLTLMLGPLEDILAKPDLSPDKVREEVEVAHRNSLRLLKLVNTLLDFSRIEAGRIQARYEELDVATFTTDLASMFRSTIERAGLNLYLECHAVQHPTFIDPDMWEKIVLNLLSNAFKFTLQGGITVRLHEADQTLILTVSDTGIGIPPEALPDLFKRFHRVDGARGRTHEGSGIGLALVHDLVHLHGGTIDVQSIPGEGTRFRIMIPTGSSHLPADRIVSQGQGSRTTRAAAYIEEARRWLGGHGETLPPSHDMDPRFKMTSGARVLLVDDNADMREYLQKILQQNWTVMTASNGAEAWEIARATVPDLVLTDVMMPILDGFGLLKALREDPRTRLIPIIMLSARAGEESRAEGMEAGADDYLAKPFSARELLARVGANLEMARISREAREREHMLRREAEEAHATTLAVLESIGDGYLGLGPNWEITAFNVQAEKINGLRREDVLGKTHWEVWPASVGTSLEQEYRRAAIERKPRVIENFYEPLGRWFEVNIYPAKDGGISCFFRDITERKEAMLRHDLARRELQSIFKHAPVGMAVLEGADYTYSLVNDEFIKLWTGSSDVLGRTFLDVTPDAREQGFLAILDRVYQGGQAETIHDMPVRSRLTDGRLQEFHVAFVYAPKLDDKGRVTGVVAIVIDITARKKAEQEREKLLAHLTEVDRRKDEFLAVLSHELRSPLNVIGGHAELLRYEEPGTQEFMDSLDAIERNTKAQTQLISDLLDISRIVTGKFLLDVSSFALTPVVHAAVDAVRFGAESKGVRINLQLDPRVDSFMGDAMRVQQLIWNLLSNAVKFTAPGGSVTLATELLNGAIAIRVNDTGKGISPDFLPYVFDRFHQEDASNTRKFGGLGLGLAIVRHIAELHGGSVAASSEGRNKGSTFTIRLPVRIHNPHEVLDDTAEEKSLQRARRPLEGLSILVVDDQQDAREMVSKAFHHMGAINNLAPSGAAALELLTIKKFDAIVCDVGMPEMNGLEFIQRWRAIEKERQLTITPAIALTAYASEQDRLEALEAGFQAHLTKPMRISELSKAVAAICKDALDN